MEIVCTIQGAEVLQDNAVSNQIIDEDLLANRKSAYLLALQLLRNPEDAMDVAQESILKFYANLSKFNRENDVRPWLMTITRNLAIDFIRRKKTRGYEEPVETIDCAAHDSYNPEYLLVKNEKEKAVWLAVTELKDKYREIIILRDYNDLSYQEIAEIVDVPLGTVMSRLHKARMHLREKLSKTLFGGKTP